MSWLRMSLTACIALGSISAAYPFTENVAPPRSQSVRLAHASIGCRSRGGLQRVAVILVEHGEAAARAGMAASDCRLFMTFRGKVVDEGEGALCVLGLGNTRCLWFPTSALSPAAP
ncbi:MAG: hypothetical protein ACLPID_07340 [Beijerinckiaceae bacterium]